jgi:hypothetical protein
MRFRRPVRLDRQPRLNVMAPVFRTRECDNSGCPPPRGRHRRRRRRGRVRIVLLESSRPARGHAHCVGAVAIEGVHRDERHVVSRAPDNGQGMLVHGRRRLPRLHVATVTTSSTNSSRPLRPRNAAVLSRFPLLRHTTQVPASTSTLVDSSASSCAGSVASPSRTWCTSSSRSRPAPMTRNAASASDGNGW